MFGDPDGSSVDDPLAWFAGRMRSLLVESGGPSLRDLVRLTAELGRPYGLSTIQAKLAGTPKPRWGVGETCVRACRRFAGRLDEPDLQTWRHDYHQLLRLLAEQRRGRR